MTRRASHRGGGKWEVGRGETGGKREGQKEMFGGQENGGKEEGGGGRHTKEDKPEKKTKLQTLTLTSSFCFTPTCVRRLCMYVSTCVRAREQREGGAGKKKKRTKSVFLAPNYKHASEYERAPSSKR